MPAIDEAQHPRADDGKFTAAGGVAHNATAGARARAASRNAQQDSAAAKDAASHAAAATTHATAADAHNRSAAAHRTAAERAVDPARKSQHLAKVAQHLAAANDHTRAAADHTAHAEHAKIAESPTKAFVARHAPAEPKADAKAEKPAHDKDQPHGEKGEKGESLAARVKEKFEKAREVVKEKAETVEKIQHAVVEGDPLKEMGEAAGAVLNAGAGVATGGLGKVGGRLEKFAAHKAPTKGHPSKHTPPAGHHG